MGEAPEHDWFLRDWLKSLGMKQADLIRALGWSKAKASDVVAGEQRYTRDMVNEVAAILNVRPFELLMHPSDAFSIRRMREDALRVAAETTAAEERAAAEPARQKAPGSSARLKTMTPR